MIILVVAMFFVLFLFLLVLSPDLLLPVGGFNFFFPNGILHRKVYFGVNIVMYFDLFFLLENCALESVSLLFLLVSLLLLLLLGLTFLTCFCSSLLLI